jgi:hypothetical protein
MTAPLAIIDQPAMVAQRRDQDSGPEEHGIFRIDAKGE